MVKNVHFTFDIETDWGGRFSPSVEYCCGIKDGLPFILDSLSKYNIKATFFVSGELIDLYKDLLYNIVNQGHEIAVHGFTHRLEHEKLSKKELYKEIKIAKESVQKIEPNVIGYRTPQFRFNPFLYEVLDELGFEYDSSISTSPFSKKIEKNYKNNTNIYDFYIKPWSIFKIPSGLIWISRFGFSNFLKNVSDNNEIIIYGHPFDFIKKKYNSKVSLKANIWYLSYSVNKMKKSFKKLISYFYENDYKFLTLQERLRIENNI